MRSTAKGSAASGSSGYGRLAGLSAEGRSLGSGVGIDNVNFLLVPRGRRWYRIQAPWTKLGHTTKTTSIEKLENLRFP
jgi:hypothetical protein